jgi:hypothetical protein
MMEGKVGVGGGGCQAFVASGPNASCKRIELHGDSIIVVQDGM